MVQKVKRRYHRTIDKQGTVNALNVPRDNIGSIACTFKVKGTVVTLFGRDRKRKLSTTFLRFRKTLQ